MGIGFLSWPLLVGVTLLTHPGTNLDPIFSTISLWFTFFGGCLVATGVTLGRRTGWKVPDPKRTEIG
jgi:hypothetical protein